jgi:hypothetical protein
MTLPFKPHLLALLCSAGLLAAAGTLYVKSREPQTVPSPAVAQTAQAPPPPSRWPPPTPAQIDQWVAPIALYPDNLLSQVLMASTYPATSCRRSSGRRITPMKKGMRRFRRLPASPGIPA